MGVLVDFFFFSVYFLCALPFTFHRIRNFEFCMQTLVIKCRGGTRYSGVTRGRYQKDFTSLCSLFQISFCSVGETKYLFRSIPFVVTVSCEVGTTQRKNKQ